MATQVQSPDFAADIGTQVYWLALLVGLLVGVGVGFHSLVDLLAALSLVAGAFDGTPALRAVAFWIDRSASSLSDRALPAFDATLAVRVGVTAAVVASGLAVARWLVRRFAPEAGGSGVQEIEGVLLGLRPMRWRRILAVKFAAGGMALGAGFVLGREGPTVQIGGCRRTRHRPPGSL